MMSSIIGGSYKSNDPVNDIISGIQDKLSTDSNKVYVDVADQDDLLVFKNGTKVARTVEPVNFILDQINAPPRVSDEYANEIWQQGLENGWKDEQGNIWTIREIK